MYNTYQGLKLCAISKYEICSNKFNKLNINIINAIHFNKKKHFM